ncbi:Com family DNA-binding transcriptional regulator [Desulfovibrio piger]|uniref:Com family DNA-binding transcriptional regulator n=1 Tax=Desulfovibrio piger TaxID=901 RepID=UPI000930C172|nr:Com family DNA-binding transcriptional regulator [Desulfovibrio piger]
MKQEQLTEIRCRHCGKLLARGWIVEASLEHKCPRCGAYHLLRATRPDQAGHGASPMEALWPQTADHTIRRS